MQSGPPPNILSVPPPLRYITFGTSWSSANALQISHFHTAYVQSRSVNKHCNIACVQSRSANKHCNTAYMQSCSANKHCNTAYMQSCSANKHCNTAYMQSRSANSHGHIKNIEQRSNLTAPILSQRNKREQWGFLKKQIGGKNGPGTEDMDFVQKLEN